MKTKEIKMYEKNPKGYAFGYYKRESNTVITVTKRCSSVVSEAYKNGYLFGKETGYKNGYDEGYIIAKNEFMKRIAEFSKKLKEIKEQVAENKRRINRIIQDMFA